MNTPPCAFPLMTRVLLIVVLCLASTAAYAVERGVLVRDANVYLSPDATSTKLITFPRGTELIILERATSPWINVEPMGTGPSLDPIATDRIKPVTGWMQDKGLVRASTPNGDQVLFGEASSSEAEATRRRGRKGAANDAYRLYRMTAEYFPGSPLAGEALYRAADIRWQLERAEVLSRPSAKHVDPYMRAQIEEELMRRVIKKYPKTKWADLAAFRLIDNKLCGDWQGEAKCPEKEADIYEKYVAEHPQSPVAAEALYQAAWREAALVSIYKNAGDNDKSAEAKSKALQLVQRITANYQNDWAHRARALGFLLEQGIPTFGPGSE
ncbi:MAG: tol-pal system YbgF family protein [Terriglobales bacterium]